MIKKNLFLCFFSNQMFKGRFQIMNTKPGQPKICSVQIQAQNQPYIDVK